MKLSDITEQDALKIADTSAIYERGESYYRSGKVTNMQIEHDAIYAVVKGNYADYQVQIAVGVNGLNYDCDCPYDGWGCKHIVAVVLLFANHKEKLLSESQKTTEGEILKETLLKLKKAELVDIIAEAAKLHSPFRRQLMMRFDLHTETVINELTKEIEKAFSDVGAAPLCPPVGAVSGCSRVDTPNNGVVATICGRPYYHPKRIARKLEKIYSSVKGQSVKIRYRIASEILNATLNELSNYDIPQEHLSNLAIDMMQEIVKLFSEQNLPRDEKLKLMDNLTTHYASCDCSLAEHIADTLLELCLTEEDYNYLVERLKHDKNLTLKLYQLMGDDETYLAERKKHLVYVADYWDLCQYYQKRGQEDDAVKTATDGVEKAQGNPLVLIEFLCSFYNRQKNYNEQIRYLMMKFEYKPSFSTYKSLLSLAEGKQREIQNQCCQLLQNHNIGDKKLLGQIYLHHKDYERLHKFVKKNPQYASDFADELEERYPEYFLKLYAKRVQWLILMRRRPSYKKAASYAQKSKNIYLTYLKNEQGWQQYIDKIRQEHRRLPALIDELKDL